MTRKQEAKNERKVDVKAFAEHLEWEQAQLATATQQREEQLLWKRRAVREAQLRAMELERRRHTIARLATSFFDKLAVLSAPEAMEVVVELLRPCRHLNSAGLHEGNLTDGSAWCRRSWRIASSSSSAAFTSSRTMLRTGGNLSAFR